MYTRDGIKIVGSLRRPVRFIPWDEVTPCRVPSTGQRIVRHKLRLKPEHFPFYALGNGVGGFDQKRDVGRLLIVDELPDGRWIDYLEGPSQ